VIHSPAESSLYVRRRQRVGISRSASRVEVMEVVVVVTVMMVMAMVVVMPVEAMEPVEPMMMVPVMMMVPMMVVVRVGDGRIQDGHLLADQSELLDGNRFVQAPGRMAHSYGERHGDERRQ
jgi:hypothetical protein